MWMMSRGKTHPLATHKHTFPHRSGAGLRAFTSNYHSYRPVRPEEIGGGLAGCFSEEWGYFSALSHSFPFLLLLCYSPFLYPKSSSFLSAFLCSPITVMGSLLPFCYKPPPTPNSPFFGSSFILCPCEATALSL